MKIFQLLSLLCLYPLSAAVAGEDHAAFLGQWENVDADTRGVTRIEIQKVDGKLIAHMWGRCHPVECDWETTEAMPIIDDGPQLHLLWITHFSDTQQTASLAANGTLLKLQAHTHYTDDSGRKDQRHSYAFRRGWTTSWADADR
jgi:hypothetical protein